MQEEKNIFPQEIIPFKWAPQKRSEAREKFMTTGIPTRRHEEWKYTSLKVLEENLFVPLKQPGKLNPEILKDFSGSNRLVFVDGFFDKEESSIPKDVDIFPLSEHWASSTLDKLLGSLPTQDVTPFFHLNEACMSEGFLFSFKKNIHLTDPLYVIHVATEQSSPQLISGRNVFHTQPNSSAVIIETYLGEGKYFNNNVSELVLDAGSKLTHCKIENESGKAVHIGFTRAILEKDSKLESFNYSSGALLARHNLTIDLRGQGAEAVLNGLYTCKDSQVIDNHTSVIHSVPNCKSSQLYKGILKDKSRGVFNGKVFVSRDAQQTNAFQLNKNLLLSEDAEIDTKPQLQIDADDVKCSHGATIGQLNEEEIFYLLSRSLSRDTAKSMLSRAFAEDVVLKLTNNEIQQYVEKCVDNYFRYGSGNDF